jgi:hypothetical protein
MCRLEWGDCGGSPPCGGLGGDWSAVAQCADSCLTDRQQAREQARLDRIHMEAQQTQQQLQYSSHSSTLLPFLTVSCAIIQCLVRL